MNLIIISQIFSVAFYNPFLKNAWDNKYEVENLHVEESITLDSGEGTLENSVNQMPRPPPRHESYMLSSTLGTDGSGSENYDMLPTRSLNSLNGNINWLFPFNIFLYIQCFTVLCRRAWHIARWNLRWKQRKTQTST